ncbi:hypothetical protein BVG16_10685 [Paenibacillus selenitireducens]|uniref:HD-GYP domain-containing protein n=1 Tax=Paenibacillus selenitireducens TaxID=1324314 RepID=A0A1T2XEU2_9BACL|nr:HD-GYP domain-containing protein [Paenibacillus selenitireducens]OPA78345.1 hypothetical protein BVG16_10685 [Paenibacillus selenitireducens]
MSSNLHTQNIWPTATPSASIDVEPFSPFTGGQDDALHQFIDDMVRMMKELMNTVQLHHKIPLFEIRKQIIPSIQHAAESLDIPCLLAALQSKDDYIYRHSIGVGVMATWIGKWYGVSESELPALSLAATLHDIGKFRITMEIWTKPEKLTAFEYALMKKHTVIGYGMLKETVGMNHRVALVALQHHERQDGSGYPLGLGASRLDLFSRIVAVADIFHALLSNRSYQAAFPFHEIMKQMKDQAFGALDPQILSVFLDRLMQSLLGKKVILNDGRIATIRMIHTQDPLHPLVQVDQEFLNLSQQSSIKIKQVIVS